jgi:hypothetical protein
MMRCRNVTGNATLYLSPRGPPSRLYLVLGISKYKDLGKLKLSHDVLADCLGIVHRYRVVSALLSFDYITFIPQPSGSSTMSPLIQNLTPPFASLILIPALLLILSLAWIIYARCFHPLAKYPGPFCASITRLWLIIDVAQGSSEKTQRRLHERYGRLISSNNMSSIVIDINRTYRSNRPR